MDHQVVNKNKTLSNFFDDEITEDQSPSFQHLSKHSPSPLLSPSPESSWSHSPAPTPSHPSLLYCCISTLRRDGDIYSIAVCRDLVLTGSNSRRVYAWQSNGCHAKGYIQASSGEVRAMLAYDDMLFTTHKDHKIRVWNMKTCSGNFRARKIITLPSASHFKDFIRRSIAPQHKPKLTFKPVSPYHRDIISCMAYYHVEGILYTGSFDRTVKTWKLSEKKCIDSFVAHGDHINDMVVNQQSGFLFTCSSDGTVKMWLRVYGECCHVLVKVFSYHTNPIYALALGMSPSQRSLLYSGSSDGCINFWVQEISTHYNHGGSLEGHQFAVLCLVAVENLVISGSEDSTIRIWRREKGRFVHVCLAVLEGHRGPVRCLAAKMQDEFLTSFLVFSASLDQTFKVWRVKLFRELVKKSPGRLSNGDDDLEDNGNSAPTPVLSPSWVKKKLQCRSLK